MRLNYLLADLGLGFAGDRLMGIDGGVLGGSAGLGLRSQGSFGR